jgi:hypothetical protein
MILSLYETEPQEKNTQILDELKSVSPTVVRMRKSDWIFFTPMKKSIFFTSSGHWSVY